MPPNGAVRSRTRNVLTQTIPARMARPTRSARSCERRVDDRRQPVRRRVGQLDGLAPRRRTSAASAPGRRPRAGRPRCRSTPARSASARRAACRRPGGRRARCVSPCRRARSTKPTHAGHVVGVDHRGDRRRRVAAVAEHVGVDVALEAGEELVADRGLDEQPRAGEADLAGVVVLAGGLRAPRRRGRRRRTRSAGPCRRARP